MRTELHPARLMVVRGVGARTRRAVVRAAVVAVVLAAAPAANAAGWKAQTVSAPSGRTYQLMSDLEGVSCPTAGHCIAVGEQTLDNNQESTLLAEAWNGSSWSQLQPAVPTGYAFVYLKSVSCASMTACEAVGYTTSADTSRSVAESWNGSTWTLQATPGAVNLWSVSCPAAYACVAVGGDSSEIWNGSTWRPMGMPSPRGAGFQDVLDGVSCASVNFCVAVGSAGTGNASGFAYADVWNGSAWSRQAVPAPTGSQFSNLDSVSCTARTACMAVGTYTNSAFDEVGYSEQWNGTAYSTQSIPLPGGAQDSLSSVSCTSATACVAIGDFSVSGGLVEVWNGTGWSQQGTPHLPQDSDSTTVSCAAANSCMMVGSNSGAHGDGVPLAETWRGGPWILVSPQVTAPDGSALLGVSCTSAVACTAVGGDLGLFNGYFFYPEGVLVERWDGGRWAIGAAPSPANSGANDVSCSSNVSCALVGFDGTGALAERWNGRAWSVEPTPGGDEASLYSVSCPSARMCMAVGTRITGMLTERWNGRRWSIVNVPVPTGDTQSGGAELYDVSCSSPDRCTAVGSSQAAGNSAGPGRSYTIAERWNGTGWSPQRPSQATRLPAVSCPTATSCNAVAQHWNGVAWSVGPKPPAGIGSISCTAVDDCTAVGSGRIGHWNGSGWSPERAAPKLPHAQFNEVACVSAHVCVLVGSKPNSAGVTVPLVERHS